MSETTTNIIPQPSEPPVSGSGTGTAPEDIEDTEDIETSTEAQMSDPPTSGGGGGS